MKKNINKDAHPIYPSLSPGSISNPGSHAWVRITSGILRIANGNGEVNQSNHLFVDNVPLGNGMF